MSNRSQDSQKIGPNCFLCLIMPIFSPSAIIKICTLSKAPPPVWPHHHQHTHKSSKNFTYGLVLGTTSIPVYKPKHKFDLKKSNLAVLAFKKNSTHLHSNQPKLKPVSESSTHSLRNYVCFFPLTSRPGSYMPTNLLPVIAPRMEPSYTLSR